MGPQRSSVVLAAMIAAAPLPVERKERLVRTFARRLESQFGGSRGVPMDFDVAGAVAERI